MLNLKNITKVYPSGEVTALREVSLSFRKSEFVSILGPSGCGKTTLLNIIGGLDRYSSGELYVRHRPTAKFSDRDWDSYRNHSIGFVFQSYNLIPHQSVLSNVELALTLSGVSKSERRRRAEDALRAVGLGDQMKKKPSQMSGGQMQRVAIARALVNDPDILLADEPTGALDSETSVQIMEILRSISKEKLIIMVTHNPDLAEEYSTRIIKLLDGRVISDSSPYSDEEETLEEYADSVNKDASGAKKTSMSFFTALSLSLNNLLTKKARTILTAFAGSIGIIGIASILALSHGINLYIDKIQEDTLSAYPLSITGESVDMTSMITAMTDAQDYLNEEAVDGVIKSNTMMYDLMDSMMDVDVQKNNLAEFIDYIEEHGGDLDGYASAISYGYDVPLYIYSVNEKDEDGVPVKLNPSDMFSGLMSGLTAQSSLGSLSTMMSVEIWDEMPDNMELVGSQYDVIAGRLPEAYNEVVLIVDSSNRINDVYLYALGFKDSAELEELMKAAMKGEKFETVADEYTYDDFLGYEFALLTAADMYKKDGENWRYMGESAAHMTLTVEGAERIEIVGIIRPNPEAVATSMTGAIGYLPSLKEHIISLGEESEIVRDQLSREDIDVLTGLEFITEENDPAKMSEEERAAYIREAISEMSEAERGVIYTDYMANVPEETVLKAAAEQLTVMPREAIDQMVIAAAAQAQGMEEKMLAAYFATLSEEEYNQIALQVMSESIKASMRAQAEESAKTKTAAELASELEGIIVSLTDAEVISSFGELVPSAVSEATLEENLKAFGRADLDNPSYVLIYSDTFEKKDEVNRMIAEYNASMTEAGKDENVINYTDYVALMMSSISTIINVISYVLIAFVSISLIVSSIMIGIITYISVLERTKEIGILRAVGASKRDISRVFNAETLIVGFAAGAMGILTTLILCIPANFIIKQLTEISNLAQLPFIGGVSLIVISMALTMIAGVIPSRLAAKKDPVEALRNE